MLEPVRLIVGAGGVVGGGMGPSGCGKTTLLYLISGLYAPSSLSITRCKCASQILQDYGLLP